MSGILTCFFISLKASAASISIKRRKSRQIFVGDVAIGGKAPISLQNMNNTDTHDVGATAAQKQTNQK
jgi:(E)-4-hydroxy-3-methylbut-2-enyl-diphosphate synthase